MFNLKKGIGNAVVSTKDIALPYLPLNGVIQKIVRPGNPNKSFIPGSPFNTLSSLKSSDGIIVFVNDNVKASSFLSSAPVGTVFSRDLKSIVSDFQETVKAGSSLIHGQNGLTYAGTGDGTTTLITAKYFGSENWQTTIEAKIIGNPSGQTGFALYLRSDVAVAKFGLYVYVVPGSNKLQLFATNQSTGAKGALLKEQSFTFAADEVIRLIVRQDEHYLTCRLISVTNTSKAETSFSYPFDLTYSGYNGGAPGMPNTHRLSILMSGGNFLFSFFEYASNDYAGGAIVFAGDSLLKGYYVNEVAKRWSYVAGHFDRKFFTLLAGGGDTSADLLNRLHEIITLRPLYCFICIGTNDIGQSVSTADFTARINSIDQQLKDAAITPIWATLPAGANAPSYNSAIKGLDSKVVDLHAVTVNSSGNGLKAEYDGGDGVHLSPAGNQAIAQAIITQCPELFI